MGIAQSWDEEKFGRGVAMQMRRNLGGAQLQRANCAPSAPDLLRSCHTYQATSSLRMRWHAMIDTNAMHSHAVKL